MKSIYLMPLIFFHFVSTAHGQVIEGSVTLAQAQPAAQDTSGPVLPEKLPEKVVSSPQDTSAEAAVPPAEVAIDKSECDDILAESERTTCFENVSQENGKKLSELYKEMKQKLKMQAVAPARKPKPAQNEQIFSYDPKAARQILSRLVTAENAWLQFRGANCLLISAESLGGSGERCEA